MHLREERIVAADPSARDNRRAPGSVKTVRGSKMRMSVRIRRPRSRACERCGREERFDDASGSWVVAEAGAVGEVYCIHEWDINGSFVPFEDEASEA
jgi:hypothetical protein